MIVQHTGEIIHAISDSVVEIENAFYGIPKLT
jgi:hypothetical protein